MALDKIAFMRYAVESCEVKENAEAAKNLVDEINDLFEVLGSGSCMSFNEAENHILEGTQAL